MSSRNPANGIAFYQQQEQLQAVEIRRHGQGYELLWQHTTSSTEETWASFAERCGLRLVDPDTTRGPRGKPVIVGISAVGVTSYRLELPVVGDSQLADMIRIQSEARLPLALDQMELGWRRLRSQGTQVVVTVAAARRQRIASLVQQVRSLQPRTLCLDSEALVALATVLTDGVPPEGILMDLGEHVTQVCCMEGGILSQATLIDIGRADLFTGVAGIHDHVLERFHQDLQRVLKAMAEGQGAGVPISLLSDGCAADAVLVENLAQQGVSVRVCPLRWDRFRDHASLNAGELWNQRVPIGLALHWMEAKETKGLFHHLCQSKESRKAAGPICSLRSAVILLVLALVAFGAVTDASYRVKEHHLKKLCEAGGVAERVKERQAQKTLAQYRPDLLDLLQQVNDEEHKDIVIDGVHFERGQAVGLTGHTKKAEAMYAFEEALLQRPGIKSVSLEKETFETKTKVFSFTILLHYKTFTKKQISR